VNAKGFLAELKRRKVHKIAIGYAIGGWALAQGIAQVFPVFDIPNWEVRLIVLLIVLGFPIALTLSWFFDLTRYGVVRTPDRESNGKIDIARTESANEKSIAVLPFADLSPARDHGYFGDGIAEEILSALAKIDGLRVAARAHLFGSKAKKSN
jgi:adenylate cyclase